MQLTMADGSRFVFKHYDFFKHISAYHFWKIHNVNRLKKMRKIFISNSLKFSSTLCACFIEENFGNHAQASNVVNFCYQVVSVNKETEVQKDANNQSISTVCMSTNSQLDHNDNNFVVLRMNFDDNVKSVIT